MDKIPMRKDFSLLKEAKRIFGNEMVLTAWVCTWQVSDISTEEEVSDRLDKAKWVISDNLNEMTVGSADIVLEFSNGNKVYFTNSEWGSFSKITEKDYYEA